MSRLEAITDMRGNTHRPNSIQAMLHRAGWRLVSMRRQGCVFRVLWFDPMTEETRPQGTAVEIQRRRSRADALAGEKP